jgi:hypothetical protein
VIEIGADVRAKRLRIDRRADVAVRHAGEWRSQHDRRNLPAEPEEGVDYEDVELSWRLDAAADVKVKQTAD